MQVVGNGPTYEWSAPLKSLEDLDLLADLGDATRADATATRRTVSRTDANDGTPLPARWAARLRGVDGRASALAEAVAVARRRGEGGQGLVVLRRLSGCLGAVGDAFHHAVDEASRGPVEPSSARYVECALWWMAQLVGSLEDGVARGTQEERDAAVVDAAEFASLYALGHLMRVYESCEPTRRSTIEDLHREVIWFATSLREELADD